MHGQDDSKQQRNVQAWNEVSNLPELVSYASSYVDSASSYVSNGAPSVEQKDFADFNQSKRRIEWNLKNFRGGQTR